MSRQKGNGRETNCDTQTSANRRDKTTTTNPKQTHNKKTQHETPNQNAGSRKTQRNNRADNNKLEMTQQRRNIQANQTKTWGHRSNQETTSDPQTTTKRNTKPYHRHATQRTKTRAYQKHKGTCMPVLTETQCAHIKEGALQQGHQPQYRRNQGLKFAS